MTLLLLLLTWLVLPTRTRASYDPFAPAQPAFPDRRLLRAGVDDDTVERLRGEYDDMSRRRQLELAQFVARNTDRAIVRRFQGRRSREDLERMTVEQIEPLLRERGLSTSGRKADLITRLTGSYDAPKGALTGEQVPPQPETPADTPQAGSGDDSGQAAPPAPQPPAEPAAPAETPPPAEPAASPPPPDPAPAPVTPETPAAAPAPDTAAPADTTTTEEAPRG